MTSEWKKVKENAVSLICKINSLTKKGVKPVYCETFSAESSHILSHFHFMLLVIFPTNTSAKTYHAQEAKHMDPIIMPIPHHTPLKYFYCAWYHFAIWSKPTIILFQLLAMNLSNTCVRVFLYSETCGVSNHSGSRTLYFFVCCFQVRNQMKLRTRIWFWKVSSRQQGASSSWCWDLRAHQCYHPNLGPGHTPEPQPAEHPH